MTMRMPSIRDVALSAAAFGLLSLAAPDPAQAWRGEGPYCLESYGRAGMGRICKFYAYEQCQAAARGIIATCAANPWYVEEVPPERVRRRRR